MGLLGSVPQCLESCVSPGALFPPGWTQGQGDPLWWVLWWPRGGVIESKGNYSSYPSNVVLLGFCLTPSFWGFHSGVLPMDSCYHSWFSWEGNWSQESPMFHLNDFTSRGSWTWPRGTGAGLRDTSGSPGGHDSSRVPGYTVLATEPKPKRDAADPLGTQSCFQVCHWEHSQGIYYLGVSLPFQNGSLQSQTAPRFHSLLPGSQRSHKDTWFREGCCWGARETSEGCFIGPSVLCLSFDLLICFFHYFCFLSYKFLWFV